MCIPVKRNDKPGLKLLEVGEFPSKNALKKVIRIGHCPFVFLSKKKLKGKEWENIKSKLNFQNFFVWIVRVMGDREMVV